MREVIGVRSKCFILFRLIPQGCPLSSMVYVLTLEPFLHKLRANSVLRRFPLLGAPTMARYFAYVDDVSVHVRRSAKVAEVS